tara:strand:- start:1703 stop:3328 length:1626 start_codon:yes stop_codon:yes gene_type:complete
MKKFLILFVVMVYSCGNTSYFEDVGIPAREDKRGDYGIVNLDGDIVVDFELDNRPSIMVENWAYFENTNGSINYVNSSSKIVETTHESSLLFNEGHVVVRLSDGQLAILDSNLNLVKTLVGIQEAGSLSEGLIKVKNSDGLWGFTNLENQEVVRSKYFNVNSYREGLAIVMQKVEGELLHGVIDKQGNEVIPMTSKYDYLTSFSEGLCVFEKDGRIGYLNAERKEVISSDDWREVLPFFNGTASVKGSDREYGLIDDDGKYIIKTREVSPIRLYNGVSINRGSNRKYGFMDIDRKLITRTEFEEVIPFLGKGAYVKDGGEWMYVDKDGDDITEHNSSIRFLFHEDFTSSIYENNTAFDLDKTLKSTFVDLNSFYDDIIDPKNGFLGKFTNNEDFDVDLLNDFLDSNLDLSEPSSVLESISNYSRRVDTYTIHGRNIGFDDSMKFSLRFNLDNSLVSKEDTNVRAVNAEAKIKSVRVSLRLQNNAYGRGRELRQKLYSLMSKRLNNEGSENSREFYIKDGRTISLSSEYSNIYIDIDYPNVQ